MIAELSFNPADVLIMLILHWKERQNYAKRGETGPIYNTQSLVVVLLSWNVWWTYLVFTYLYT